LRTGIIGATGTGQFIAIAALLFVPVFWEGASTRSNMDEIRNMKIFIGYDSREDIAYQVARHSLIRHSKGRISVHPIRQAALRELGIYTRPEDTTATTEFSLTRFLTPYLASQTDGWVIFSDCDFLYTTDVTEVVNCLDPAKAVYVVQHEYEPSQDIKMDGQKQTRYPRKNWSSFVVFNCAHPDVQALTPAVLNSATPAYLHRFEWISNQDQIGALDLDWNFLEGEYPKPEITPRVIHYTNGGPWFEEWQNVDYADLWRAEEAAYLASSTQTDVKAA
jgi:lipopolysaccharide biosynthesis glycosyltransferase